ncbi:hypothetical protein BDQ12DRAFT_687350 [Crucibulum laeve]|uniref:Uncharacterized protein n=1 Tax=Crucibulum laeve TaxID=68775 RepID=A0A5C3LUB6_9AGAR|nr:hypothetical protein BDQ12DRAFT_687350 [Crucibulum laeve]
MREGKKRRGADRPALATKACLAPLALVISQCNTNTSFLFMLHIQRTNLHDKFQRDDSKIMPVRVSLRHPESYTRVEVVDADSDNSAEHPSFITMATEQPRKRALVVRSIR